MKLRDFGQLALSLAVISCAGDSHKHAPINGKREATRASVAQIFSQETPPEEAVFQEMAFELGLSPTATYEEIARADVEQYEEQIQLERGEAVLKLAYFFEKILHDALDFAERQQGSRDFLAWQTAMADPDGFFAKYVAEELHVDPSSVPLADDVFRLIRDSQP